MGSADGAAGALSLMAGTGLDAVVAIDSSGLVVEWNQAAERVFGWSRCEALGQSMATLIVPDQHRQGHQMGMDRYQRTGEAQVLNRRIEITAVGKSGRGFPIELSIVPLVLPEPTIFVGFMQDIRSLGSPLRITGLSMLPAGMSPPRRMQKRSFSLHAKL